MQMRNSECGLFPGSAAVPAAAGETPALPGNAGFFRLKPPLPPVKYVDRL